MESTLEKTVSNREEIQPGRSSENKYGIPAFRELPSGCFFSARPNGSRDGGIRAGAFSASPAGAAGHWHSTGYRWVDLIPAPGQEAQCLAVGDPYQEIVVKPGNPDGRLVRDSLALDDWIRTGSIKPLRALADGYPGSRAGLQHVAGLSA